MPAKKRVSKARLDDEKTLVSLSSESARESVASRYGRSSTKEKTGDMGELDNLLEGISPFSKDNSGHYTVKDAIELSRKAYWNVSVYKQTIDMQTELCNSKIHLNGGSKTSLKFFRWWLEKINIWHFGYQWFKEYALSSNVITYRLDSTVSDSELRRNTRVSKAAKNIPLKYTILNPSCIAVCEAQNFIDPEFGWVLTASQVEMLKKSTNKDAKQIVKDNQLDKLKKQSYYFVKLDPNKIRAVFNGKLDYEPLAIPMYYPVLRDINLKLTLQKAEQVITRTIDKAILLLSIGPQDDIAISQKIAHETAEMLKIPAVGRSLVVQQGSKGEWLIPDLNKIFGPEKYKSINEDIANGLMNIFWGEEKLGSSIIKIKIFLERLKQAREAFINLWLKPEMKHVAEIMGFESIPEPSFEEISLKDDLEYMKIANRLYEIGFLTPKDVLHYYQTGEMPTYADLVEHQREFVQFQQEGLFIENINVRKEAGRPTGSSSPRTQNEPGIQENTSQAAKVSIEKLQEGVSKITSLMSSVKSEYKRKHGIARLRGEHEKMVEKIAEEILLQEEPEKWQESVATYVNDPFYDNGSERKDKIMEIAAQFNTSIIGAVQFFDSQI